MNLNELIKENLCGRDLNALAGELGYSNREKGVYRIRRMIESENLGMDESGYDFKYSNKELLLKLCELLGIDQRFCEECVRLLQAELLIEEQRFKPYILVETGFKTDGQCVFTIGGALAKRYIGISDEIGRLPLRQQLTHVKDLVRCHYAKLHGEGLPLGTLPVWGKIQSYIYNYSEAIILVINPDGWVVGTLAKNDPSQASLTIKGWETNPAIILRDRNPCEMTNEHGNVQTIDINHPRYNSLTFGARVSQLKKDFTQEISSISEDK
ncbi:MAG: hypothetical protein HGA96_04280 [Desulfobulbaceae bacterium]|nr:hypothetical protein [Desulfobulbaceae bacterium]